MRSSRQFRGPQGRHAPSQLTQVEEETTESGHLDGLAGLNLTSLDRVLMMSGRTEVGASYLDLLLGELGFLTCNRTVRMEIQVIVKMSEYTGSEHFCM